MGAEVWVYRGRDRNGRPRGGGMVCSSESLRHKVRYWFEQGWRELTVTSGGHEVGCIGRVDGKRAWWALPESGGGR